MKEDSIFINRELSWLDFDRRVLALSKDKNVPLAEQLKFLSIYASNLDEFFMVRVGSLYDRALLQHGKSKADNKTNMTPAQQLSAIMPRVSELQENCDKNYQHLLEALAAQGYRHLDFDHLDKDEERFWKKYFQTELFPVLSPQIVDARHPFPFLQNKDIYLCLMLKDKGGAERSFGIIPVPPQLDRLLFLKKEDTVWFALMEELIAHFAAAVFDGTVLKYCLFRVTRNADITADEARMDYDIDYREIMAELLKKRRKLAAVRIQFSRGAPAEIMRFLCSRLMLPEQQCFAQQSPLDLGFLFKLYGRIEADGRADLCYPAARPMLPPPGYDLMQTVQQHDVLLAYPYQSIRPFVAMLQKAAADPEVVSIKMTLYRMAHDSQIVQALIDAAENGKEVVALVELRARFDEQNNIDWSKQLEQAGCTVIYGFAEYKVHSKLTLITRHNAAGFSYITQIGTGNYNEKTSELYTDFAFITADPTIGAEAAAVFKNLAVQNLTQESNEILVAPLRFKSVILDELDQSIAAAMSGKKTRVILKNNSISDLDIILKIAQASQAGVRIDMIVRGICCVRAGVPGQTENLHVRSIVGRYLEHSRIYCFETDGDTHLYIASGDFLTRNTECRVEVGVRIRDAALIERLRRVLELQLADTVNAREMRPDGTYAKVKAPVGTPPVDSQMGMYALLRGDWDAMPAPQPPKAPAAAAGKTAAAPAPAAVSAGTPAEKGGFWHRLLHLFR